jgi:D-alanine-D-alanine ligase
MEAEGTYHTAHPRNVALLCGGISNEREISLKSAENVKLALEESGHTVCVVDTQEASFVKTLIDSDAEVAFIALHGKGGEDGSIQGMLELMGIPYIGSGIMASALAMDKLRSKLLFEAAGLMTPPAILLTACEFEALQRSEHAEHTGHTEHHEIAPEAAHNAEQETQESPTDLTETLINTVIDEIGLPCVVKPQYEGSSVGVSMVRTHADLQPALRKAFAANTELLVEAYIEGVEVTVPILGNDEPQTLPIIEVVPAHEFYDFESKYEEGGSRHIIPARLSPEQAHACNEAALVAHEIIGCRGVSRVDFIIDATGIPWVLEINSIPGMTSTSLLPDSARVAGIPTAELYDRLLLWALEDTPLVPRSARKDRP